MEQMLLVERLVRAKKHVADSRRRLDCQRELVTLIKESGRGAETAENLLRQLAAAYALNLAKLQRIRASFARLNAAADAASHTDHRSRRI
jgi:hypothetical protein